MFRQDNAHPVVQSRFKVRAGPSGIHLFDRSTGLNVLLDEISLPTAQWATAPRQVSVALTNACDLACRYCYAPKTPCSLEFEQVTKWLVELDACGCMGVGFGGGEPTLYRRFADLCKYAADNTRLAVTFTTNGSNLNDPLIAKVASSVNFVRVSMDGVGTTYEQLRGRPFAALRKCLDMVRTSIPFGINYVVNAHTVRELDAASMFASEVGAAEFLLLPEQPVRNRGGIDDYTVQALRRWVRCYHGSVPLTVSEAGAEDLPVCNPLPQETGLRSYAHIDASGIIKRSCYDSGGVAIGPGGVMQALETLQASQEAQQ